MTGTVGTRVRTVELKADWTTKAQCSIDDAQAMTDSAKRLTREEVSALIAICDGCPVTTPCAQRAIRLRAHGVWAGIYIPLTAGPERRHAIHQLRQKAGVA